jgi:hypothetical protein
MPEEGAFSPMPCGLEEFHEIRISRGRTTETSKKGAGRNPQGG